MYQKLQKYVCHFIQQLEFQVITEQIYKDVYLIIHSLSICLLNIYYVLGADMFYTFMEHFGVREWRDSARDNSNETDYQ